MTNPTLYVDGGALGGLQPRVKRSVFAAKANRTHTIRHAKPIALILLLGYILFALATLWVLRPLHHPLAALEGSGVKPLVESGRCRPGVATAMPDGRYSTVLSCGERTASIVTTQPFTLASQ
jgi:hypothetical protein